MANPTQTPATGQLPSLPTVFEGDALYDHIMGEIEPDLVSSTYKTLDEKYAEEIPEQKAARQDRYDKAFAEYERRFALYVNEWNGQLRTFQTGVIRALEAEDHGKDDAVMTQLENSFATAL